MVRDCFPMGRGDELYQYGSWHADKKICDLKHCSVSCIYSRANTCTICYAEIYNYRKRNINWSCLDGYVVCSSYDDVASGTYPAMYRSDYHDIHAYLHFTRKKI